MRCCFTLDLCRRVATVAVAGLVASCGGGGGEPQSNSPSPSAQTASVTYAPDVPAPRQAVVTHLVTRHGVSSDKETFPSGASTGPILALDDQDTIVAAGFYEVGKAPVISAASTAAYLAQFFVLADGRSESRAEIESLAAFPILTSAVANAMSSTAALETDERVSSAIVQLMTELRARRAVPAQGKLARALAVTPDPNRVSQTKLPAEIVPDEILGLLPVQVRGTCQTQVLRQCPSDSAASALAVANNMPLAWNAKTTGAVSGQDLANVYLAPADPSILSAAFTATTSLLTTPSIALPTSGLAVNISIGQNDATERENVTRFAISAIGVAISLMPTASCGDKSDAILYGIVVGAMVDGKVRGLPALLDKAVGTIKAPTTWASVFKSCLTDVEQEAFGRMVVSTVKMLTAYSKVAKVAVLPVKWTYITRYSGSEFTFGVCLDRSGRLMSCLTSLAFDTTGLWVGPGVVVSDYFKLLAKNDTGLVTLLPADLATTVDNFNSPGVLSIDSATEVITANKSGVAQINSFDSSTSLPAKLPIGVVDPGILVPNKSTITVGESVVIGVQGPGASPAIQPTDGVTFTSSDTTVLAPNVLADLLTKCPARRSCYVFGGLKSGSADVTFTSRSGKTAKTRITVIPSGTHWEITWKMDSCATLPVEIGTWSTFRCNVTGGWAGAYGGTIYLANSMDVSGPNAVSEVNYGLIARRPKSVDFGSTSMQFAITYRWADNYSGVSFDEQVPVAFTVLGRSASLMSGSLSGTSPYLRYIDFYNANYRPEVRRAPFAGTWTAVLKPGPIPLPNFTVPGDFCTTFGSTFQSVRDDKAQNVASQGTLLGLGTCSF